MDMQMMLSNVDSRPAILPKILAVDDRPENLRSLQRILSEINAEIITVASGQEALAQVLRHEFAVILLDVMMPEMDGFETAALIRNHESSRNIPIIFVTAADKNTAYEDQGYCLGAVDYLFKPLQPAILLSKVRVFIEQARQQQLLLDNLQEIQQLRDNNALLLSSVGEGILSLDQSGAISFANPAAARLLGIAPQRLLGTYLSDYLLLTETCQSGEYGLPESLIKRCRAEGQASSDEYTLRHADGHAFPVEYTVSMLHAQQGPDVGVVLAFQDISERKEREALEMASKYKSAFLANISHELRTPLHSLLILAKKLAANGEGNLNAEQLKAASIIHHEGQDLLHLINDILDLSKVEAGKMSLYREAVSLAEVAQRLQSQFAPLAAEKKLHFQLSLGDDLPDTVQTDRQRLQQILKNLLVNAVKFTHQGTVTLSINRVCEAGNSALAFAVADTGIGIAADKQAAIFESFQQVDQAINRHYEGSGLGLAICRELAALLDGKIAVQSELQQGSCFTFYLPLQAALHPQMLDPTVASPLPSAALLKASEPVPEPAPKPVNKKIELLPQLAQLAAGKTLLLLDSDMRNSFNQAALFRRHGFTVIKAENCATGVARLCMEERIDIIVMALELPGKEAEQFFAAVTAHNNRHRLPVHLLLDAQMQLQAESALPAGSYEVLLKPTDLNWLLARLTACLDKVAGESLTILEKA
jgi:PAS domain S-box-containing protein